MNTTLLLSGEDLLKIALLWRAGKLNRVHGPPVHPKNRSDATANIIRILQHYNDDQIQQFINRSTQIAILSRNARRP